MVTRERRDQEGEPVGDDLRFSFRRPGAPARRRRWGVEVDIAEHGMSERAERARQNAALRAGRPADGPAHVQDPSEALRAAWGLVDGEIARLVGEEVHGMWLAHLHPHGRLAGAWYVGVDARAAAWITTRYGPVIELAAGRPVRLVACEAVRLGQPPS